MNEDRPSSSPALRSWRERLGQVLLGEPQDREQLIELLRNACERGLLDPETLSMIEGALVVGEMQVRDIMVPRSQMVVVERDAPLEDTLQAITHSAHSRFPVIGESRDDIIGILLAKDMLLYCRQQEGGFFNIRDILRPAVFIPESKRLNVLLREFRSNRNHMAIVVDEYGGTAGLVTIEDVLEQIVGDIEDEHDISGDACIFRRGEDNYTVKALTPIEDFNEYFGADLSDEEFDTIGGLVLNGFGRVPERGESITMGRFEFKVLRADSRRIHLLELHLSPKLDTARNSVASIGS
jgi:magnesium and cobalt transporter